MDETGKIKKADTVYVFLLVLFILAPIVVLAVCMVVSFQIEMKGFASIAIIAGPFLFASLWWIIGGIWIRKSNERKLEHQVLELKKAGFVANYTFKGSCILRVDTVHRKIAMQFSWNPSRCYVAPAERITKAWVDDGRKGRGITEGSKNVSFLFMVDGITVKIPTFFSAQRYSIHSNEVLTGISKADVMVEVLNRVRSGEQCDGMDSKNTLRFPE